VAETTFARHRAAMASLMGLSPRWHCSLRGGDAVYTASRQWRPPGRGSGASAGATILHAGGHDGVVCCNDEGLARCFWIWHLVGKVVVVALSGMLSLLDEDGDAHH
jgi:hypothetical protein